MSTSLAGRPARRVLATGWRIAQVGVPVVVLTLLARSLGAEPFRAAVDAVSAPVVLAAVGITGVSTVCAAWRWQQVAAQLGIRIPLSRAVPAYYRSQLLNVALPLGVVGDLHRGLGSGRENDDVPRGLRSVVWERVAGQVALGVLTLLALLVVASPLRRPAALFTAGLAVTGLVVVVVTSLLCANRRPRRLVAELRSAAFGRRTWWRVGLASTGAVVGHTGVLLLAVAATSSEALEPRLVPVALLVLVAAALPLNLAGWGPREGAAVGLFSVVGMSAGQGLQVSVVYGVLALVGVLPGLAVVSADGWRAFAQRRVLHA